MQHGQFRTRARRDSIVTAQVIFELDQRRMAPLRGLREGRIVSTFGFRDQTLQPEPKSLQRASEQRWQADPNWGQGYE
jgi:hypothetical protein